MTWTRYAHRYLHRLLIELDPPAQLDEADESQAIFCPNSDRDASGAHAHGRSHQPDVHVCTHSGSQLHRVDL